MNDGLPELFEEKRSELRSYLDQLLDANKKFNLTAVRSEEEAWSRHIVESATLCSKFSGGTKLIDVGTGGGLPGMVIAICRPDISVTLLEATEKKIRFLESVRDSLSLSNTTLVCDRAETAAAVGSPLREAFDIATARAVAPLAILLELTVPFVKVGGTLVAVKGDRAEAELKDAERAQRLLKSELVSREQHPSGQLLTFRKKAKTEAGYPRKNGEPKRRPL